MNNIVMVPHSAEAVNNLVAIEQEHLAIEKYPELSCGCGCDRDDDEIENWTYDDLTTVCQKSLEDPQSCRGGIVEGLGEIENSYGEVLYPCPTLLTARASASTETLVAITLILGGNNG